jgi:hypothetical protein
VIAVYAIADHPGPPLPGRVDGLRVVPAHRLAAICGDVEEREVSPNALWQHEEVVEALMEQRDLLPVRYGTRLPDEAHVVAAVAERHDALLAALDRVRDATELSLRVAAQARASTKLDTRESADLLRAAYLVDRDGGEAFTAAVADEQRHNPELRLLCTGPWPPYSFAAA